MGCPCDVILKTCHSKHEGIRSLLPARTYTYYKVILDLSNVHICKVWRIQVQFTTCQSLYELTDVNQIRSHEQLEHLIHLGVTGMEYYWFRQVCVQSWGQFEFECLRQELESWRKVLRTQYISHGIYIYIYIWFLVVRTQW